MRFHIHFPTPATPKTEENGKTARLRTFECWELFCARGGYHGTMVAYLWSILTAKTSHRFPAVPSSPNHGSQAPTTKGTG